MHTGSSGNRKDGSRLFAGTRLTGFTNEEERQAGLAGWLRRRRGRPPGHRAEPGVLARHGRGDADRAARPGLILLNAHRHDRATCTMQALAVVDPAHRDADQLARSDSHDGPALDHAHHGRSRVRT
jgi:hypothetical protein